MLPPCESVHAVLRVKPLQECFCGEGLRCTLYELYYNAFSKGGLA